MKKIEKLLVCIDLSEHSQPTLESAVTVAGNTGAEIHIINVLNRRDVDAAHMIAPFYDTKIDPKKYVADTTERRRKEIETMIADHFSDVSKDQPNQRCRWQNALPILTGVAFDAIVNDSPNLTALLWASVLLVFTQIVRTVLQLGRNFGSEVLGQRLERDTRDELYASLLGKSMGFHDLHATGDIMARATNDVRELALMMAPGLNLVLGSANFLIIAANRRADHPSIVDLHAAPLRYRLRDRHALVSEIVATGHRSRAPPFWRDECRPQRVDRRHRNGQGGGTGGLRGWPL